MSEHKHASSSSSLGVTPLIIALIFAAIIFVLFLQSSSTSPDKNPQPTPTVSEEITFPGKDTKPECTSDTDCDKDANCVDGSCIKDVSKR